MLDRLSAIWIWDITHVLSRGVALEIWLNGLVLLVEVGQIGNKVLDDVGVRQRVDARFGLGISGDTACTARLALGRGLNGICPRAHVAKYVHKQARVLTPSMFMAQEPQIPSRHDLRKVKVGSSSFFIRMRASSIMGPVLFRSRS